MRFVSKNLNAVPTCLSSAKTLAALEEIAKLGGEGDIKDTVYKGTYIDAQGKTQSQVRDSLNIYYKEKCAYCEGYCKAEIEHYRPKKGVTGDSNHKGYYWLCYEWSNLLPSCRYCNTEGGKGNKFPLIDSSKRIYEPPFLNDLLEKSKCTTATKPLISEQPLLLNPEVDNDYHQYFTFKINIEKTGIEMIGIDNNKRGENTIEICNLNRNVLQLARLEVYYTYRSKINTIFELNAKGFLTNENIEEALFCVYRELEQNSKDITTSYTLLKQLILSNVDNFTNIFSSYIENKNQRAIAVTVFRNYKNQLI